MKCPNCGHTIQPSAPPTLQFSRRFFLQLILWLYAILSWLLIAESAIKSSGPRGAPIYNQPPLLPSLLTTPAAQIVIGIGAALGLGLFAWEVFQWGRKTHECDECGHRWA
jgi:hypothetical protein